MLFTKMHGLGNAYVILNQIEEDLINQDLSELSKIISDVNFGIGADGIILISSSKAADFQMRIFNEDGSEAQTCGNGLRCVAKYLFDHMYATTPRFTIETGGGVVDVEVELSKKQTVESITVNMGEPKLLKGMIPMIGDPFATAINESYTFEGNMYQLTCLSMGNPHAILFVEDVHSFPLEKIGQVIEHSRVFPERVNVGIVQVTNRKELKYRVWERGSGITMACGSGACAAVVAATLNELVDKFQPVTVHLPGGDLTIEWDEQGHIWKKGAAAYICHGEWVMNSYEINKEGI